MPIEHVTQLSELAEGGIEPVPRTEPPDEPDRDLPDLSDLYGHPVLRRCLEIAAAGAHSLLLIGPPGGGKTLALQRLPSLLPPLSANEVIEVTRIAGVCGENGGPRVRRPFRAPHHTVSGRALVGGGAPPRPGEVTRAHRGVLFLDELGEFRRDALEALRAPLEDGAVTVARTSGTVSLPCRFMLVAASNPCPCGNGPGVRGVRMPPGRGLPLSGEAERRPGGPHRHHPQGGPAAGRGAGGGRCRGLCDRQGARDAGPPACGGASRLGPGKRGDDSGGGETALRARRGVSADVGAGAPEARLERPRLGSVRAAGADDRRSRG